VLQSIELTILPQANEQVQIDITASKNSSKQDDLAFYSLAASWMLTSPCVKYSPLYFSSERVLQWKVFSGNSSIDGKPPSEREAMGFEMVPGAGNGGRLAIFGGAGSNTGIYNQISKHWQYFYRFAARHCKYRDLA
jgi:hypothetical protein